MKLLGLVKETGRHNFLTTGVSDLVLFEIHGNAEFVFIRTTHLKFNQKPFNIPGTIDA